MNDETRQKIRDTLVRLLSRREHSVSELQFKLQGRGYEQQDIAPEIQRLTDLKLQSDLRFAEVFVRNAISKGQGKMRIQQELKAHNLLPQWVTAAFAEQETDWFELAKQVHDKKFTSDKMLKAKEKHKHIRYLQYRGFNTEQIKYACRCRYQG